MAYFNPICESITVSFTCPECGEEVESDAMGVPSPNFAAENNSDSMNYEDYEIVCGKCGHCFQVTLYNAMYGGEVEVDGVDDIAVDEEYAEDEEDYDSYVFDVTPENLTVVLNEVETLSAPTKEYLYRQLYAGAITSMEAFLSSTLLKEVLSSNENKRKFVEKYLPYRKEHIALSKIFEQMDKIDATIQESLRGLMYHNLSMIKPIYKDVLDIDLGDIGDIMKAIQIRHDIVHRSGKDKEGNFHEIKKEDVTDLVQKVSFLMSAVSSRLAIQNPFDSPQAQDIAEGATPWDELIK